MDDVKLQRKVGLIGGVSFIVGTMIGSGIFASPSGVYEYSGSPFMSLICWALCGMLSLFGALSYAELGTMIPKSGGEFQYLLAAFGPFPAFLFAWTTVVVLKPSATAAMGVVFATYAIKLLPEEYSCEDNPNTPWLKICIAASMIMVLGFIHMLSLSLANKTQTMCTAAKLLAIVLIILIGIKETITGDYLKLNTGFKGTIVDKPFRLSLALYQGLFSYDGWNQLNFLTEELKNPKRNLPLAIMIGIPLVLCCYVLMNIAYFATLSTFEVLTEDAIAVLFAQRTIHAYLVWIIPLSVCFSTLGSSNGELFTCGRIAYASAREGHLPRIMSFCHVTRSTPILSVLASTVMSCLYLLMGDFKTLVDYFSFAAWIFYTLTVAGLLYLRYKWPDKERIYKVNIVIPVIFVIAGAYLVIAPLIAEFHINYIFALIFIVGGLIYYVPFGHYKVAMPFLHPLFFQMQKIMAIAPSYYHAEDEDSSAKVKETSA